MGYRGVPTTRKRIVGNHLRRLRKQNGMSLEDVAEALGISRSAADRKESGYSAVSVDDLRTYLDLFKITDEDYRSWLEALVRLCARRGWWSRYNSSVGTAHVNLADAEDLAAEIYYVRSAGIPSLLETEAYASAELDKARPLLEAKGISVEKSLELRARRREILKRDNPPKVHAILAEPCVLTMMGGVDVMRGQIEHLVDLAMRPTIDIRILPMDRGYPASKDALTIMKFAGEIEGGVVIDVSGPFEDEPEIAGLHLDQFSEDRSSSLSAEESLRYLRDLLSSFDA